jgi:protein-S-isoprenylcysteine O-methyltransferase Ste14
VIQSLITVVTFLWLILEVGLLVRDRVRGQGGTADDRGSRTLNFVVIIGAAVVSQVVASLLRGSTAVRLPAWQVSSWHVVTALVVILAGLVVRVWAILMLGQSFRTTVEVDADQSVVDRGPYRWIRHPSYTGILLILIGMGIDLNNWISLAIVVLLPLAALLYRIGIEEKALCMTLGEPYLDYQQRTKRLVPGLW